MVVEVGARALDRRFTYGVPEALLGRLVPGSAVEVPFGARRLPGFVLELVSAPEPGEEGLRIRAIEQVLDPTPVWGEALLGCVGWMRRFYGATWLECLQAAIPGPVLQRLRTRLTVRRTRVAAPARVQAASAGWPEPALNPAQRQAVAAIREARRRGGSVLLFGVTGSGKTEVYLQAVRETLEEGRGAVVLVPELALTPQALERYRGRLQVEVGLLHSGLSGADRREQWWSLRRGERRVALGTRSAVFAPVEDPGLFVVDEEHETSYKEESAPRYHARQVAFHRAGRHGAGVVLGSATPSLESYHLAREGRFQLVELPARAAGQPLPEVRLVDMKRQALGGRLLSHPLAERIRERVAAGEQVVLLLNRRGYAHFLQCPECGWVPRCGQCSVSLAFHRSPARQLCHTCGQVHPPPDRCPGCGGARVRPWGAGTERLEAEVRGLLPGVEVVRMDSDTTTRAGSHARLLERFAQGEAKVLLGTRMIAKGLDFPSVTLVGVIRADAELHLPDFRAGERTFQLLAQVAGRAGRGARPGEVILQALDPEHPCLQAAARHDYRSFAGAELQVRQEALYPPFCRLLRLLVTGLDEGEVMREAARIGAGLRRGAPGLTLVGPAPCPVERVRGRYRWHLLLKGAGVQELLERSRNYLGPVPGGAALTVQADPDPQSLM